MSRGKISFLVFLTALNPLFLWLNSAEAGAAAFTLTPLAGIQSTLRFGRLVPLPQTADVPGIKVLLEHKQPALGLSLGYRINGYLEFEGAALYDRTRIVNDVGIGFGGFPLGKFKVSDAVLYSLSGCLLFKFRPQGLSPYLGTGIGAAILDTEKIGSKTRLYFLVRAGIRAPLTDRLCLALDVRDSVTFFKYAGDFRVAFPLIYAFDFKETQHSAGAFLGLRYVF